MSAIKQTVKQAQAHPLVRSRLNQVKHWLTPSAEFTMMLVMTLMINLLVSTFICLLTEWKHFFYILMASNCIGLGCFLSMNVLGNITQQWLSPWVNALVTSPIASLVGAVAGYHAVLHKMQSFEEVYVTALMICVPASLAFCLRDQLKNAKLRTKVSENERLKAEQQASEMKLLALQHQIEPHFLFNILANIRAMIGEAPTQAETLLDSYTEFLRLSMRINDRVYWSLDEELQLIKHYIAIQQQRFPFVEVEWQNTVPAQTERQQQIPPLIIQPLIENAFNHAFAPQGNQGILSLSLDIQSEMPELVSSVAREALTNSNTSDRSWLAISVRDNGVGFAKSSQHSTNTVAIKQGNRLALRNIRQRLQYAYKGMAAFELSENIDSTGCTATVFLPLSAILSLNNNHKRSS